MATFVTVDCDCSCEKEKSLIRSFLSSVVCSSQSVDCSIQWHSVVVVGSGAPSFLCVGLYSLCCTVLVSRGSFMVRLWRHSYRFLGPNYVHLRYRRFFFLPTLLPPPLDGGVQLDKSLQNALAPLLNARDVRRAPSAAAAACGTSARVASFLKQAQALFGA